MFSKIVRVQRESLGLTQIRLSGLSGVSLPTIQNIEAHRANPELETVQRLLKALGMEAQFVAKKADWDFLSLCGVPLLKLKPTEILVTRARFIEEMRLALSECEHTKDARKFKAMGATLLALRTHYPDVYAEFARCKTTGKLVKMEGILKLRRVALDGLARFL